MSAQHRQTSLKLVEPRSNGPSHLEVMMAAATDGGWVTLRFAILIVLYSAAWAIPGVVALLVASRGAVCVPWLAMLS